MKRNLILLASALVLAGCANFNTKQTESRYESGKKTTTITTKATAYTFFSSKSALQNFKATQTDKTQSATVGSLTQETEAATNVVSIIEAVISAAIKAAAK